VCLNVCQYVYFQRSILSTSETTREKERQQGNKQDIKPVTLLVGLEGLG
jgi:hypothetical protein